MSTKTNPPEFYDVKYLKSVMGDTGGLTRWEDNGAFYQAAVCASQFATSRGLHDILDVGCGRGFVVRHLRNLGHTADGIEYGLESVEHSVCGAKWGDLTSRLPVENSYDLVLCNGVLSHLPKDTAAHALLELHRVTKKYLWATILVEPRADQRHHLTIRRPEWWIPRFSDAGFLIDVLGYSHLALYGQGRSRFQWTTVWRAI